MFLTCTKWNSKLLENKANMFSHYGKLRINRSGYKSTKCQNRESESD